jgi:glycosyltransferase involved in cell wall biosynthesis
MQRVLFTSPIIGAPPAGGPELRIYNTLMTIASQADVIVYVRRHVSESDIDALRAALLGTGAVEVHFSQSVIPKNRIFSRGQSLLRRATEVFLPPREGSDLNRIVELVGSRAIDIVWLGYGNISYPLLKSLRHRFPSVPIVCDTDSVWSRFILRGIPFAPWRSRPALYFKGVLKQFEERRSTSLATITAAVSEHDAEYYRSICAVPDKVKLLSNVIDIEKYLSTSEDPITVAPMSVCLTGTFGHKASPMDTAAAWLINEIWPIVLLEFPEAHLYLVGLQSDVMWGHRASPQVHVTGRVASTGPYLRGCAVVAVPLMYESGTRFKILEAGAYKRPIVSTTLGAEGLLLQDGEELLLADTTEEFARCIVSILNGTASAKLGDRCYEVVNEKYGLPTLNAQVEEILLALKRRN